MYLCNECPVPDCRYLFIVYLAKKYLFLFGNDIYRRRIYTASKILFKKGTDTVKCPFFTSTCNNKAKTVSHYNKTVITKFIEIYFNAEFIQAFILTQYNFARTPFLFFSTEITGMAAPEIRRI